VAPYSSHVEEWIDMEEALEARGSPKRKMEGPLGAFRSWSIETPRRSWAFLSRRDREGPPGRGVFLGRRPPMPTSSWRFSWRSSWLPSSRLSFWPPQRPPNQRVRRVPCRAGQTREATGRSPRKQHKEPHVGTGHRETVKYAVQPVRLLPFAASPHGHVPHDDTHGAPQRMPQI